MSKGLVAEASILIDAPKEKVWDALINPEMIKQYLFGTEATSDWTEGSSITYKGQWQDTSYEDKGVVVKVIENELLETTYWSSMSGTEDNEENYANVKYQISEEEGKTKLTITQDNNKDEETKNHSEKNWNMVLDSLKKLLETS